ncbi:MAG: hypothetical protein HOQ05_03440 [Corynebacteriales bacterium]|nr:hypothetical protein [Mycobacteriales bacterium]
MTIGHEKDFDRERGLNSPGRLVSEAVKKTTSRMPFHGRHEIRAKLAARFSASDPDDVARSEQAFDKLMRRYVRAHALQAGTAFAFAAAAGIDQSLGAWSLPVAGYLTAVGVANAAVTHTQRDIYRRTTRMFARAQGKPLKAQAVMPALPRATATRDWLVTVAGQAGFIGAMAATEVAAFHSRGLF